MLVSQVVPASLGLKAPRHRRQPMKEASTYGTQIIPRAITQTASASTNVLCPRGELPTPPCLRAARLRTVPSLRGSASAILKAPRQRRQPTKEALTSSIPTTKLPMPVPDARTTCLFPSCRGAAPLTRLCLRAAKELMLVSQVVPASLGLKAPRHRRQPMKEASTYGTQIIPRAITQTASASTNVLCPRGESPTPPCL